jgi:hypothetical protein
VFVIHGPDGLEEVIDVQGGALLGGDFGVTLDVLLLEVAGDFGLEQDDVVPVL